MKKTKEITLTELLTFNEFYSDEDGNLCSKITLDRINLIADILSNYYNRIDKAINKIQYIKDLGFDYDGFNDVEDLKKLIDELVDLAEQSIDILRGKDNE